MGNLPMLPPNSSYRTKKEWVARLMDRWVFLSCCPNKCLNPVASPPLSLGLNPFPRCKECARQELEGIKLYSRKREERLTFRMVILDIIPLPH